MFSQVLIVKLSFVQVYNILLVMSLNNILVSLIPWERIYEQHLIGLHKDGKV